MIKFNAFFHATLFCLAFLPLSFLPNHIVGKTAQLEAATVVPEQEDQVYRLVNRFRVRNSLGVLIRSEFVDELAREHSIAMADRIVPFGHSGSGERFDLIEEEFPNADNFGENVATNRGYRDPARAAFRGWKRSPGHRRNMLGDFNQTGVGVARRGKKYYFTQIFFNNSSQLLNMPFVGQGNTQGQYAIIVDCLSAEEVALLDRDFQD